MSTGSVKLKPKDVAVYRTKILKLQDNKCAVCGCSLRSTSRYKPALDHCHDEGYLRGVLCIMCNQAEGRVRTWATRAKKDNTQVEWLRKLVAYLESQPKYPKYIHPTHRTAAEKRLERNAKARAARAKLKGK